MSVFILHLQPYYNDLFTGRQPIVQLIKKKPGWRYTVDVHIFRSYANIMPLPSIYSISWQE